MQSQLQLLPLRTSLGKFFNLFQNILFLKYYFIHLQTFWALVIDLSNFITWLLTVFIIRNNYATFKEIKTKTISVQGQRGESKKAKLFITLSRGPDFFENMKKFSEIKEENEQIAKKIGTTPEPEKKAAKKWKAGEELD